MLTLRLDQMTEHGFGLFKQALHKQVRTKYLWAAMVALFRTVRINRWDILYRLLSDPTRMIDGATLLEEPELKTMHRLCYCWSSGSETSSQKNRKAVSIVWRSLSFYLKVSLSNANQQKTIFSGNHCDQLTSLA